MKTAAVRMVVGVFPRLLTYLTGLVQGAGGAKVKWQLLLTWELVRGVLVLGWELRSCEETHQTYHII